jgi:hypothetical protein
MIYHGAMINISNNNDKGKRWMLNVLDQKGVDALSLVFVFDPGFEEFSSSSSIIYYGLCKTKSGITQISRFVRAE